MQIQLHTLCTQVYAVRQSAAVLMLLVPSFPPPKLHRVAGASPLRIIIRKGRTQKDYTEAAASTDSLHPPR